VQEADVLAARRAHVPGPPLEHGGGNGRPVVCDVFNLDGTPFEGCPRHTLRRTSSGRAGRLHLLRRPEVEYFYFSNSTRLGPKPIDAGSYFDSPSPTCRVTCAGARCDARGDGHPVEHAQHEDAPSQHEIDLRYTDALTMADTFMTVRLVVKEMARQEGVYASFMPSRSPASGSGLHTHLSLWEGERNAFYDPADPWPLHRGRQFIAALAPRARDHR